MCRNRNFILLVIAGLAFILIPFQADGLSKRRGRVDKTSSARGGVINFTMDDEELSSPDNAQALIKIVDLLKENRQTRVKIVGYSDDVGIKEYNEMISLKRAEKAKGYLEEHGIWSLRIETQGKGEADPIASNETSEGRAKNRRVELKIY